MPYLKYNFIHFTSTLLPLTYVLLDIKNVLLHVTNALLHFTYEDASGHDIE